MLTQKNISNSTDNNGSTIFNSAYDPIWFGDIIIMGVLVLISFYLLVALLFHKIKVEKRQEQQFLCLSLEKRYGVLSTYLCIVIAVVSFLRQSNGLGRKLVELQALTVNESFTDSSLEKICNVLPSIGNISVTVGGGFAYLFLWLRQRVFYVHPCLKVLSNKLINVVSFGIVIVWLLYFISLLSAYFTLVQHQFRKPVGCVVVESAFDEYTWIVVSWTLVCISMQIALLCLFLYPIIKGSLWRTQHQEDQSSNLFKRVKKAVILASICLATDLLTISIRAVVTTRNGTIALSLFATNLVVNHLVTIVCFDHWKKLLWPWSFGFRNISTKNLKLKTTESSYSNPAITASTDM